MVGNAEATNQHATESDPEPLSAEEHARLAADLEPVTLSFKEPIHEQGKPIRHLYFQIVA
jgi:hypothetical protein